MKQLRDLIKRLLGALAPEQDPLFAAAARAEEHYQAAMAIPLDPPRSSW